VPDSVGAACSDWCRQLCIAAGYAELAFSSNPSRCSCRKQRSHSHCVAAALCPHSFRWLPTEASYQEYKSIFYWTLLQSSPLESMVRSFRSRSHQLQERLPPLCFLLVYSDIQFLCLFPAAAAGLCCQANAESLGVQPSVPCKLNASPATRPLSSDYSNFDITLQQPQLLIRPLNLTGDGRPGTSPQAPVAANGMTALTAVKEDSAQSQQPQQCIAAQLPAEKLLLSLSSDSIADAIQQLQSLADGSCPASANFPATTVPSPSSSAAAAAAAGAPAPCSSDAVHTLPLMLDAAAPAPTAPAGASSLSLTRAVVRKHRFSRDQHAAILESVERNYALYPSRYTELVIKEMQAKFPGLEINNACVRKIKFRWAA